MRRFFAPPEAFQDDSATISGDLFRHLVKVLRLQSGERILLTDGKGNEYTGSIGSIGKERVVIKLEGKHAAPVAAGPRITLYQGLPKADKLDLVLQKSTELGAAEIIPFTACRSIARIRREEAADKVARWQRIVREAARQSGRPSIPDVRLAGDLKDAVESAHHSLKLLLWEEEELNHLKETLQRSAIPESIALLVGPEGGLTGEEVETARNCGFIAVSLGPRIVRTETAGLALIAILQFYWGDLG